MREVYYWGFFLLIAGACCGLIWPLMLAGAVGMSVAFGSVYIYYTLKGRR
jgi:hypothetical protein